MTQHEKEALDYLIGESKKISMTADQVTEQRRSFAYGNSAFENGRITRRMVEEEAKRLGL